MKCTSVFDTELQFKVASFVSYLENNDFIDASEQEYMKFCKSMTDNFHYALENKASELFDIIWKDIGWVPLSKTDKESFLNEFFNFIDLNVYDFNKSEDCDGFIKKYIICYLYNTENMSRDEVIDKYDSLIKRDDISSLYSVLLQIYLQDISPNISKLEEIKKLTSKDEWRC